uniref:Uncharacterized protein n=1 Tax=Amphimedon queenslandica TaxID=400682 RepID=A0A1X7TLV3_AMPQE
MCHTGSELPKSLNYLRAIGWIAQAWNSIQESTSYDGNVISRIKGDPFENLDSCQELQGLVDEAMQGKRCSAEEYISDDDLHFRFDVSNDQWEQEFFTIVLSAQENSENDVQSDTEKSYDKTVLITEPKIKSMKDAILLLDKVLSETVADIFTYIGDESTKVTQKFVLLFDKLFDCLNIRDDTQWCQKEKPDLKPYREIDDDRFEWLEETFLGYLNEWKASVISRTDLSKDAQSKLLLSRETQEGL